MGYRIAASFSMLVFAITVVNGIRAGNAFTTTIWLGLKGLVLAYILGLLVGWIAQRMLNENLKHEEERIRKNHDSGNP
jgi:hypothetical protein